MSCENKHIEKCANFKRMMLNRKQEVQICKGKGRMVFCGGFSDGCHYPKLFRPDREVPQDRIIFNINEVKFDRKEDNHGRS